MDERVQVLAATREARAQLAQQDRQSLAVRQAQHVVYQVQIHPRAGVGERQQVLALTRLAVLDRLQRWTRCPAGIALDELLADQRLRPDGAVRVAAERR